MDEDVIDALADAFAIQLESLRFRSERVVVLDDVYAVACVIHVYQPTYDLRYFYKRVGAPEPYPEHPID